MRYSSLLIYRAIQVTISRLLVGYRPQLKNFGYRRTYCLYRMMYKPSVQVTISRSLVGYRPWLKDSGYRWTCYLTVKPYLQRLAASVLYGYCLWLSGDLYLQYCCLVGPQSYLAVKQSPWEFSQESVIFFRLYFLNLTPTPQSLCYDRALSVRICCC